MPKHREEEEEAVGDGIDLQEIERQMSARDQENQFLRSQNLGYRDAAESNFMPKPDSNVIEYKLDSGELLERIEHYLRGDILKTRTNDRGETESYYAVPTKKISVTLYKNKDLDRVYVVNEHPKGKVSEEEEWDVLSIFEHQTNSSDEEELVETPIEDNYKPIILAELQRGILAELQRGLAPKSKKAKVVYVGVANKEVIDTSRTNMSEYGVQEVMNILSMYITKETFLSWYKEERIYEILGDIGDALNKFFLINSKLLGLDTEYKKTKYPVIVITILHAIENAYRRALLGSENKGTREGILISQHQPMGSFPGQQNLPSPTPKKKWSPFDKSTW